MKEPFRLERKSGPRGTPADEKPFHSFVNAVRCTEETREGTVRVRRCFRDTFSSRQTDRSASTIRPDARTVNTPSYNAVRIFRSAEVGAVPAEAFFRLRFVLLRDAVRFGPLFCVVMVGIQPEKIYHTARAE
jgi:hypothetical protein